jgi:protein-disulfide isomerase
VTAVGRALAALVALAAVAGMAVPGLAQQGKEPPGVPDMVLGDPEAPIKIVEYASLTCPHCASFHNDILPRLKADYIDTGKARLIYRDFPLDRVALQAAVIARCAGDDRFFAFIDVLYGTQGSWARASQPIDAMAAVVRVGGLKREAIDACLADKALVDGILAVRLRGDKDFGVNSTPTFIINGEKVIGALNYERFKDILDRMVPK